MKDRQVDSIQNMFPCTHSIRVVPSRLSMYRFCSPTLRPRYSLLANAEYNIPVSLPLCIYRIPCTRAMR